MCRVTSPVVFLVGSLLVFLVVTPAAALRPQIRTVPGEAVVRSHHPLDSPDTKGKSPIAASPFFRAESLVPKTAKTPKGKKSPIANKQPQANLYLLRSDSNLSSEELVAEAKKIPGVLQAEPNYIGTLAYVPSDPQYNQTADHFARIGLEDAWDKQPGSDASIAVAVIDSGVDPLHADLDDAIHPDSWNFVEGNDNIADDRAHGTRVAGIIGAEGNNGEGIAGIAFGCQILSLDVADSQGLITTARVIAALDHATNLGTQVINMSITFRGYSQMLEEACEEAAEHAVLVAASGNENQSESPVYPASFDSVIGVGATMLGSDDRALFSNYNGLEDSLVDLVAPGVNIYTTIPGSMYDGQYTSGTSFAAPMVSGVAALLQSSYPTQSPAAIANHLKSTAAPLGNWAGYGRLSAVTALRTMMAPSLSVASVAVDDSVDWDAGNDEDGNWDAGETVRLVISLFNEGGDADDVIGTLASSDPDISLTDTSTAWGVIASDETEPATETIDNAFISASAGAHDALFSLAVSAQYSTVTGVQVYNSVHSLTIPIDNTYTPPEIITADTTWTSDKTYVIETNTIVMPSATLTIEPGTTLQFGPDGGLEIRGGILSHGTFDQTVDFTSEAVTFFGDFDPQVRYSVGDSPHSVAIGDVENDGDYDIVTANSGSNSISLIRWNGSSFDPEVRYMVGTEPFSVAIGDVDNDGNNDIVTANNNNLSILRWNGSDFDPEVRYAVGSRAYTVAIGDADNDGDNDIATANYWSDDISFLRCNGSDFDPEVRYNVDIHPPSVAIGDADNDGDNDIVIANMGSNNVWLLRWDQTDFDNAPRYTVGGAPHSVVIGDPDNDGDNDIVTANHSSNDVSVLRWNGSDFDPDVRFNVGVRPHSVAIGDVDNDGDYDIVTANSGSNSISLIRWNGSSFGAEVRYMVGSDPKSVAIGDAGNDGNNDIVTANYGSNNVSLLRWNEDLFSTMTGGYSGIWVRSTCPLAAFSHCRFQFGPVLDESAVGSFSDCIIDRTGDEYGLSSVSGSIPLVRCEVVGNGGGDGIRAGSKTLIDCLAENNSGVGLQGGALLTCEARSNGSHGMVASSAEACVASSNGGSGISSSGAVVNCTSTNNVQWGISTTGNVEDCFSSFNSNGISGVNVSNSVARANTDKGIQASGNSTNNLAKDNGGVGISGNNFTDSIVVGNGSGVSLSGTALRTYVGQNEGNGVTGGSLVSSTVLDQSGKGAVNAAIQGSWIVRNSQGGSLLSWFRRIVQRSLQWWNRSAREVRFSLHNDHELAHLG